MSQLRGVGLPRHNHHVLLFAALLGSSVMVACATIPRRPAPTVLIAQVAPEGFPASVRFLFADRDSFVTHAKERLQRVRAAAGGGALNILALSGGGAGGAFGAGALVGLSLCGTRPEFQVVTGVSAGALIAPFAFLGPAWDGKLEEGFRGARTEHLLQTRGLGFLSRPGYYKGEPLVELVDSFITDELVEAVAQQAAKGRLLMVATTDLDKEETVIWDMGAIAAQGGERARVLFRDVLVASASIPGVFPPVLIHVEGGGTQYDEMHVDGGTTVPFFLASEVAGMEPQEAEELEGGRVFVLVNGQLSTFPKTTPEKPLTVLSRSFSASLTGGSRRTLALNYTLAHLHGMQFHFSYIPMTYPYQGSLDFKPPAMQALFDYGMRCAEQGRLWTTIEQAIEEGKRTATTLPKQSDECPVASGDSVSRTPSRDGDVRLQPPPPHSSSPRRDS
jgi:predicted acylesterase/phospholipase RssA